MNKLMARIVAVVMAIAMLGTVSFAAGSANYADGNIADVNAGDAANQDIVTVLAFATNTANDTVFDGTDKIIAVVQATEDPTTIPVVAADVEEYDYITVAFGGSNGETDYAFINNKGEVTLTALDVQKEITLTVGEGEDAKEVTYTNVAYAHYTGRADKVLSKVGVKFNSYDAEGEAFGDEQTFEENVNIAINGTFSYGVLILGVPYDDIEAAGRTVKAYGYVE
ncbi:MAG: hypothetical protein IJW15_01140 [Clostridia bacterium]|nr:hypothetical protein [Clostridia bacterium]